MRHEWQYPVTQSYAPGNSELKPPPRKKIKRSLTSHNLMNKKPGKKLQVADAEMQRILGDVSAYGVWLVYGKEKNGKTWFALQLAKLLSKTGKVAYISAEENLEDSFLNACRRAGITAADRILWDGYMGIDDLIDKFSRPKSPQIIFVDNLTAYMDELKPTELKSRITSVLPDKLWVFVAHEDRNEPYPATARQAKRWANVIVHVQGLKAFVTSRFSTGGEVVIDETKSELYWGIN
jgi:predicted ATP-dependent serine protease